jgi:Cu(I)/Ag(I) efflux system protein CusF
MNRRNQLAAAVTLAALALVGCDESPPMGNGSADTSAMPGMDSAQGEEEHVAQGTVNSIDRAAGTINISHEPVESAGWPAMTMNFRLAQPDVAAEVEPGQRIEFRFTTDGGGTVTAIDPSP